MMITVMLMATLAVGTAQPNQFGEQRKIEIEVANAAQRNSLPGKYRQFLAKAQERPKDPWSRVGAVWTWCSLKQLGAYGLANYHLGKEFERVQRMSEVAIRLAPSSAFPLLAKMRLLSNADEALGPLALEDAASVTMQSLKTYKNGKVISERMVPVYHYEGADKRLQKHLDDLIDAALKLEPSNPAVLLWAAQVRQSPKEKLKRVAEAAKFGAKKIYPTSYLFSAMKAYDANGQDGQAAIARASLRAHLAATEDKIWTKLFRLQHPDFAK